MIIQSNTAQPHVRNAINQQFQGNKKALFKESLQAAQMDQITISARQNSVETPQTPQAITATTQIAVTTEIAAKPWADDPYNNIGIPYGDRTKVVLTKLAELREEAKHIDYTGMTDLEIYKSIQDRYEKAFGAYGEVDANYTWMAHPNGSYVSIDCSSQMRNEIFENVSPEFETLIRYGKKEIKQDIHIKAMYGEMTLDERSAHIQNKYPNPQTTNQHIAYLSEMARAGCMSHELSWGLQYKARNDAFYAAYNHFGPEFVDSTENNLKIYDLAAQLMGSQQMDLTTRLQNPFEKYEPWFRAIYDNMLNDFLKESGFTDNRRNT